MGRIEYGPGYAISEIVNDGAWPMMYGLNPMLNIRFKETGHWVQNYPKGYRSLAVLNCYGDVEICGICIGFMSTPAFFKVYSLIPDFKIMLNHDGLSLIEERRGLQDVEIVLRLHILCAFDDTEVFNTPKYIYDTDLVLSAVIKKSDWLEKFLPTWSYFEANEAIIPLVSLNNFPSIKKHIIDARKAFGTNNPRDCLDAAYRAVEALHKSMGYQKFKELLDTYKSIDSKSEAIAHMFHAILGFLNKARHDQTPINGLEEAKTITREDARLALIYSQLVIDYVINNASLFMKDST